MVLVEAEPRRELHPVVGCGEMMWPGSLFFMTPSTDLTNSLLWRMAKVGARDSPRSATLWTVVIMLSSKLLLNASDCSYVGGCGRLWLEWLYYLLITTKKHIRIASSLIIPDIIIKSVACVYVGVKWWTLRRAGRCGICSFGRGMISFVVVSWRVGWRYRRVDSMRHYVHAMVSSIV